MHPIVKCYGSKRKRAPVLYLNPTLSDAEQRNTAHHGLLPELSTPEFYHPDLLAVLRCDAWKGDRAKPWHITPLLKIAPQLKAPDRPHSADWSRRQSKRPRDLDWSRNSPVANELVDTLNGALEDMGGGHL